MASKHLSPQFVGEYIAQLEAIEDFPFSHWVLKCQSSLCEWLTWKLPIPGATK
jgi:hypothetical protein